MKKKSLTNGLITIIVSLLIFSCSNNDTAKSDAKMATPDITGELTTNAAADSIAKTKELTAGKDSTSNEKGEKDEKEENEKNEK